jgi:hypothetical protein
MQQPVAAPAPAMPGASPYPQYAPPQMPASAAAPQATRDAPSQPHVAPTASQPAASDPNTTLRTRNSDDGLDTPPKNRMPIYALIGVVVIAAAIVAVVLMTQ